MPQTSSQVAPWTATERNDVSLPQRSPAPALTPRVTYGQPTLPRPRPAHGVRLQPGVGPVGQRPLAAAPAPAHPNAARPVPAHPNAARPVLERPAPRTVAFLTVAEVAAMMRVSKMTVYRLVHAGEMAAVRVGRSFRVPESAVRTYLADGRTDVA